jgi:monoamine oxidase
MTVGRLRCNQAVALQKASISQGAGSLASFLLSKDGIYTGDLSTEEKPIAEGLARTLEIGMGTSLEEVSLRWNGYEDSFKGTDAGPEGGFFKVIEALAESIRSLGGEIRLQQEVTQIKPFRNKADPNVSVRTSSNDSEDTARIVISTIPLAVLKKSHTALFETSLSTKKITAIQDTKVGQLGKVVVSYDKAWWRTDVESFNILPKSPASRCDGDARSLLDSVSLVVASFASEALSRSHPTLLAYLPAPVAVQLESMTSEQVGEAIHALFLDNLPRKPGQSPTPPLVSRLTAWSSDPFSLGATSTPPTGDVTPLNFVELGKPEWDNQLLFAGEHTSINNRGSVTGAVETGEKEGKRAARLLNAMDSRTSIYA